PSGAGRLAAFVLVCALLGMAMKYPTTFVEGGLSTTSPDGKLLSTYLGSVLLRVELLLLAAMATAGTAVVYPLVEEWAGPAARQSLAAVSIPAAALCYVWLAVTPVRDLVVAPDLHYHGIVTADDLALIAWIDANPALDDGLIAAACQTFFAGLHEKIV